MVLLDINIIECVTVYLGRKKKGQKRTFEMEAILKTRNSQEDPRITGTHTVQLFVQPCNNKGQQYLIIILLLQ